MQACISEEISLIIPVRDRLSLLKDAIESVLEGTVVPGELIVAIDALSKEGKQEEELVRSLLDHGLARGSKLHTCWATVGGPSAARNAGIRRAHGRWIAFLDSDDLWTPGKLEAQVNFLNRRPHLRACQTGEKWIKNGRELMQPERLQAIAGRRFRDALETCLISPSSVILRSDVFLTIGLFDENYPVCEDYEFWLRYLGHYPMGLVPQALTIKRSGAWPQQSRSRHSLDQFRIQAILKTVQNEKMSRVELEHAHAECRKKFAILYHGATKRKGGVGKLSELLNEIKQVFREHNSSYRYLL